MKSKVTLTSIIAAVSLSLFACASVPKQVAADDSYSDKEEQKYQALEATADGKPIVGAAGKEIWTFKALKKGKSTISMEYRRFWEKGAPPAKTFSLTVVVK